MSRKNESKSDILSGSGALWEGYRILKDEHGITDADWRQMLANPAIAAQVAAVLRNTTLEQAHASLELLIAKAKGSGALTGHMEHITSENFKESGHRGQLRLIDLGEGFGGLFSTKLAREALERMGFWPANMWELAYYARSDWDRKTFIAALGSPWYRQNGNVYVGELYSSGDMRTLRIVDEAHTWHPSHHKFLVVPG